MGCEGFILGLKTDLKIRYELSVTECANSGCLLGVYWVNPSLGKYDQSVQFWSIDRLSITFPIACLITQGSKSAIFIFCQIRLPAT